MWCDTDTLGVPGSDMHGSMAAARKSGIVGERIYRTLNDLMFCQYTSTIVASLNLDPALPSLPCRTSKVDFLPED